MNKRLTKITAILLTLIMLCTLLAACGKCQHVDEDGNGICDECGDEVPVTQCQHLDENNDGKCDKCQAEVAVTPCQHVDADNNGKCDKCQAEVAVTPCEHIDENNDGKCDKCQAEVEKTNTEAEELASQFKTLASAIKSRLPIPLSAEGIVVSKIGEMLIDKAAPYMLEHGIGKLQTAVIIASLGKIDFLALYTAMQEGADVAELLALLPASGITSKETTVALIDSLSRAAYDLATDDATYDAIIEAIDAKLEEYKNAAEPTNDQKLLYDNLGDIKEELTDWCKALKNNDYKATQASLDLINGIVTRWKEIIPASQITVPAAVSGLTKLWTADTLYKCYTEYVNYGNELSQYQCHADLTQLKAKVSETKAMLFDEQGNVRTDVDAAQWLKYLLPDAATKETVSTLIKSATALLMDASEELTGKLTNLKELLTSQSYSEFTLAALAIADDELATLLDFVDENSETLLKATEMLKYLTSNEQIIDAISVAEAVISNASTIKTLVSDVINCIDKTTIDFILSLNEGDEYLAKNAIIYLAKAVQPLTEKYTADSLKTLVEGVLNNMPSNVLAKLYYQVLGEQAKNVYLMSHYITALTYGEFTLDSTEYTELCKLCVGIKTSEDTPEAKQAFLDKCNERLQSTLVNTTNAAKGVINAAIDSYFKPEKIAAVASCQLITAENHQQATDDLISALADYLLLPNATEETYQAMIDTAASYALTINAAINGLIEQANQLVDKVTVTPQDFASATTLISGDVIALTPPQQLDDTTAWYKVTIEQGIMQANFTLPAIEMNSNLPYGGQAIASITLYAADGTPIDGEVLYSQLDSATLAPLYAGFTYYVRVTTYWSANWSAGETLNITFNLSDYND